MRFRRLGQAYHPVIETARDLKEAVQLDEALWVATSAPVDAFRMDPVFLGHLDNDADTRIKCGELMEAVTWTLGLLQKTAALEQGSTTLSKGDIASEHPQGKKLLSLLGELFPQDQDIAIEKIREARKQLEAQPVSEAGVILPDAADTEAQRADIEQLLVLTDGVPHPCGKPGLNVDVLNQFAAHVQERLAWEQKTSDKDELGRSVILPLGSDTSTAFAAFTKVQSAIDHFFQLCRAAEMAPDPTATSWPGLPKDLNWQNPEAVQAALRNAPISQPSPERLLKIDRTINPAWQSDISDFRHDVLIPLLDRTDEVLTEEVWNQVCDRLAPFGIWKSSEPHAKLAGLSESDLQAWATGDRITSLMNLCNQPGTNPVTLTEVRLAEKLALYQGYLMEFTNNFIAFPYLYEEEKRASFEMGSLVMDGRKFHLAVRVPDRKEYLKSLEGATMFVMIVQLVNPQLKQTFEVAVPATAGQQGNLRVGKHGVFEHVDGSQWFATVVHIQDNAISFSEAIFEPFKRLGNAITRKIESLTQAAEKKLEATGGNAVTQIQGNTAAPAGGMLAGGGIAVAALGSSLAFITKIFSELQFLGVLQGILIALLAVLIPGSIVAYLRLSKRDLSVLLEGADWAINSRMRLNATQRKSITRVPKQPEGSTRIRPREWWLWRIFWVLLLAGLISLAFLPQEMKTSWFERLTPSASTPAAEAPES